MADEPTREYSQELEVYGELGALPKLGVKIRLARKGRIEHMIDSAARYAELDRAELEDLIADAADRVHDVVVAVAQRASEVDDDDYLDILGRLVAGALDSAVIDELAYVVSEITKLEPVHLRALLGFFYFGAEGDEAIDPDMSPADSAWATNRARTDREIAYLLKMSREAASQVLLRLDRDGLVHLHGGPEVDNEKTSVPTDWAGKVLSLLFPSMKIEFRNLGAPEARADSPSDAPASSESPLAVASDFDPFLRNQRAITELESEIKQLERQRHGLVAVDPMGGDRRWLEALRRRLRKIDPNNPWAYDDD